MHLAQSLTTLSLDAALPVPLFRQLYAAIKTAILNGQINPGMQLPPSREFAQALGVSRQTVLNAYSQLTAEGYFSGTVGKGTFVSDKLSIQAVAGKRVSGNPSSPVLRPLRILSSRGQRYMDPQTRLNVQQGAPRAFRTGMPAVEAFPFDVWARLEARRWRRPGHALGYSDPAGHAPLRELIAAHLRASRGVQCVAEQIIITSGSQQSLFLIASLLLAPNDPVWVENPGYRGASSVLHATGAQICPVMVDQQGLCVTEGAKKFPEAALVYVTPSHQYPLGVVMSLQRRLELLAWAADKKAWVVEDDYDSEYRYTGPLLASLQSLDKVGSVIYIGTLSKLLFPGLRLGYLVSPAPLVDAFTRAKALMDRHTAIIPQIVLADFIAEGHFSRHIKRTRALYHERRDALLETLAIQLADKVEVGPSEAGLQLAIAFKNAVNDQQITQSAALKGIEVRPLSEFYAAHTLAKDPSQSRQHSVSGLLLGFAAAPIADIRNGIGVLRALLK